MAINPGADLLTDALAAADPQRAKAAEERLTQLAAGNAYAASAPAFRSMLASENSALKVPGAVTAALSGGAHPGRSGDPYQQFEVVVLKSLFEFMLPAKASAVFGSGFAGEAWRSMLADALAGKAGQAGVAGIARALEARKEKEQPNLPARTS